MKTSVAIVSILALTFSAIGLSSMADRAKLNARQQFGLTLMEALHQMSSEKYLSLLPSASDFHVIMKDNAAFYGDHLSEAQKEFSENYETKVLPAAKKSFERLLQEGIALGVDWKEATLFSITADESNAKDWGIAPVTVTVSSKGQQYKIRIDKAMLVGNQWKASQFITLF